MFYLITNKIINFKKAEYEESNYIFKLFGIKVTKSNMPILVFVIVFTILGYGLYISNIN